jgi:hypothetical protein
VDWTVYWFMLPVCVVVASVAMFSGISGAAMLTPVFLISFPMLGVRRLTTVEAVGTSLLLETSRFGTGALAEIAALVGDDPAPHRADARRIRQAILDQLWDRKGQRFGIRNVRRGQRTPEDTIIAFSPLLDPALPRPMVVAITGLLGSPCFHPAEPVEHYLVPTYDLRAPGFDPRRYWRGPVWINTDWLLWLGLRQHGVEDLAAELRASMLGLVRKSGFREYFHPFGGQGYGAGGFAWTAALVIDVLHRDRAGSGQPRVTAQ